MKSSIAVVWVIGDVFIGMYKQIIYIYIYLLHLIPTFFWVEVWKPGFFPYYENNLVFLKKPGFPQNPQIYQFFRLPLEDLLPPYMDYIGYLKGHVTSCNY